MARLQMAAVYVGGLIGPFIGQSLIVVLPEMGATFGISVSAAALCITLYMLAFATTMLFSTRLVRNFRPRDVVLVAYLVIAAGAAACLLTPSWLVFCAAFMVMGFANAFTTPVLQIILRQLVPRGHLGGALGTFTAMQSMGVFIAPVVAGVAARWTWQGIFAVVIGFAGFVLACRVPRTPPPAAINGDDGRIQWAPVIAHMATSLVVGMSLVGMPMVLALEVGARFGLDTMGRALVVMVGGFLAFLLSRPVGRAADRFGDKPVLLACLGVSAFGLVIIPFLPLLGLVTAAWALAIVACQGVQTAQAYFVLRSPGGASLNSTVQAFRFYGLGLTPLVVLPLYQHSVALAFAVPAALLVAVALWQAAVLPPRRAKT